MADNQLQIQDTSYAGTFAQFYWLPATFGLATVKSGLAMVHDARKQITIGTLDFSNPFQPRQPTPVAGSSSATVIGTVIIPQDLMLYFEFDPRDFEVHWEAEKLSPQLLNRFLGEKIENFMMYQALRRAYEKLEVGLWQGSKAWFGTVDPADPKYQIMYFDGWIVTALKSATNPNPNLQVLIEASPSAPTVSNIGTLFENAKTDLAAAKPALFAEGDQYDKLKFLVSIPDMLIFQDYITTGLGFKGVNVDQRPVYKFGGYEVVGLPGIPQGTFFFGLFYDDVNTALHIGMNSLDDNKLELRQLQNNSELYFIKGLMKYAVNFSVPSQIYMSTLLTLADFGY